jgi:hypothetical protein
MTSSHGGISGFESISDYNYYLTLDNDWVTPFELDNTRIHTREDLVADYSNYKSTTNNNSNNNNETSDFVSITVAPPAKGGYIDKTIDIASFIQKNSPELYKLLSSYVGSMEYLKKCFLSHSTLVLPIRTESILNALQNGESLTSIIDSMFLKIWLRKREVDMAYQYPFSVNECGNSGITNGMRDRSVTFKNGMIFHNGGRAKIYGTMEYNGGIVILCDMFPFV